MVPLPSIQPSTFVLEQLSDLKLVHRLNKFAISCQSCSGHPVSPLKNSKTACNEGTNVPENSLITSVVNLCATWGWSHGITMLQDGKSTFAARLAPYSLIPTPIPRQVFELALKLSPLFSKMIANITLATDWLYTVLKKVGELDPHFSQRLLDIAQRTYGPHKDQRRIDQDIRLIFIRSDYMINHQNGCNTLQQVEVNTISISFAGLAESLSTLHRLTTSMIAGDAITPDKIPRNNCCQKLAEVNFGLPGPSDILGLCILFIVRANEQNEIDQRKLEFCLAEFGPNGEDPISVKRRTFEELTRQFNEDSEQSGGLRPVHLRKIDHNGKLVPIETGGKPKKARLFIANDDGRGYWEVSLIYYRAGYDPSDYDSNPEGHWLMREVLERSDAVKCPNVLTHLAGVKKVQSLWNDPKHLALCLPSEEDRQLVSQTFIEQVDPMEFHKPDVLSLVQEAIQKPSHFVLKPQREGGLHNIHGQAISETLKKIISGTRSLPMEHQDDGHSYILMRKIRPQVLSSITLHEPSSIDSSKAGMLEVQPCPIVRSCVSELGTFGVHLADGAREIMNHHGGYLLRTKDVRNPEGGVVTGAAFLDSPLLVDESIWHQRNEIEATSPQMRTSYHC